jgi:uncharacterized protein YciI
MYETAMPEIADSSEFLSQLAIFHSGGRLTCLPAAWPAAPGGRAVRSLLRSKIVDFDRMTITLLELREDAPELAPEEAAALQDAHLAFLAGLHAAGQLLAAGPLLDRESPLRGLSVLNVGVAEARALAERDPAVQAGRFRVIALPWLVPAGAMSFAPAFFPRSSAEAARTR